MQESSKLHQFRNFTCFYVGHDFRLKISFTSKMGQTCDCEQHDRTTPDYDKLKERGKRSSQELGNDEEKTIEDKTVEELEKELNDIQKMYHEKSDALKKKKKLLNLPSNDDNEDSYFSSDNEINEQSVADIDLNVVGHDIKKDPQIETSNLIRLSTNKTKDVKTLNEYETILKHEINKLKEEQNSI